MASHHTTAGGVVSSVSWPKWSWVTDVGGVTRDMRDTRWERLQGGRGYEDTRWEGLRGGRL